MKEKMVVINTQLYLRSVLDSVLCNFFKCMAYDVTERALALGSRRVCTSPRYATS